MNVIKVIINKFFLLLAFLIVIQTNSYSQEKDAVLLIHGLGGASSTWSELINNLTGTNYFYVGNYRIREDYKLIFFEPIIGQIEFNSILIFTMDFSDNQNLNFTEQGNEVKMVVDKIKNDFNINKIVLMGHSMGGLAARAYMMNYCADDIKGLITVSTPHSGSFLAYIRDIYIDCNQDQSVLSRINKYYSNNLFLNIYDKCTRINSVANILLISQGIHLDCKAINYLAPDSPEMKELYNQILPPNLPVVNVISIWDDRLEPFYDNIESILRNYKSDCENTIPMCNIESSNRNNFSDGVVTIYSQLMKYAIKNSEEINPEIYTVYKFHTESTKDFQTTLRSMDYIFKNRPSNKISLAFILDSSGSMGESDPKDIRKNALNEIVQTMENVDNLLIFDFDDQVNWINPDNYKNRDNARLSQQITSINSDGGTKIGQALQLTNEVFSQLGINQNAAVILLSDGMGDYNGEAQLFNQYNIPVFTISLLDKINENLMSDIAQTTKGNYYKAYNEFDIIDAYFSILQQLLPMSIIYSSDSYQSNTNQQTKENFNIEPGVNSISIRLFSSDKFSNVTILQPDGQSVTKSGAKWITGDFFTNIEINAPQHGKWEVSYSSEFIANSNSHSKILVTGILNNINTGYQLTLNEDNQIIISPPADFLINGYHITQESVEIQTPNGKTIQMNNELNNNYVIPTDYTGSYKVNIYISGIVDSIFPFQRFYTSTFFMEGINPMSLPSLLESYGDIVVIDNKGSGVEVGDKCYIYSITSDKEVIIAYGHVVNKNGNKCTVEMIESNGNIQLSSGYSIVFVSSY